MKSKLFVLRVAPPGGNGPQLEYYDSDRKFRGGSSTTSAPIAALGSSSGGRAKRVIGLRDCLSITAMVDTRKPNIIAVYTPDECFGLVCASEADRTDWLEAFHEALTADVGAIDRPHFDYIWTVSVKPRGLGCTRYVPVRSYRLCLTDQTLALIRLKCHEPDIVFQLASIRRCGHSDCHFFMELGRSAVTGAGELWLQVDDSVVAQGMHEVILSKMKSNSASEQPNFRQRSRSSVSDKSGSKPISMPARGYDSATLPLRSKTIGSGDHARSPLARRQSHSPGKGASLRLPSTGQHSPVTSSPLSFTPESQRSRTNSIESHGSRGTSSSLSVDDDYPHSPPRTGMLSGSLTPTRSGAVDSCISEMMADDYLPMAARVTPNRITSDDQTDTDYMGMSSGGVGAVSLRPPTTSTVTSTSAAVSDAECDGYMDMSPMVATSCWASGGDSYMEMSSSSNLTSSVVSSSASSGHDTDDGGGYLDMLPVSYALPTVQEKHVSDDSYLKMSPSSSSSMAGYCSSKAGGSGEHLLLEKVPSYLHCDDGDQPQGDDASPRRAYSVGSKPAARASSLRHAAYVDMSGGAASVGGTTSTQKSSSAPHLPGGGAGRHTWLTPRRRDDDDVSELLMEMEFGSRPRSASGGHRDLRHRALTTAAAGRNEKCRPRTSTICLADSLRPRTSSFGADMRPRSASHGNGRYVGRVAAMRATDETTEVSKPVRRRSSAEKAARQRPPTGEAFLTTATRWRGCGGSSDGSCATEEPDEYVELQYGAKTERGNESPTYANLPFEKSDTVAKSETRTLDKFVADKKSIEMVHRTDAASSLPPFDLVAPFNPIALPEAISKSKTTEPIKSPVSIITNKPPPQFEPPLPRPPTIEPVVKPVISVFEPAKPSFEQAKPSFEPAKPSFEPAKPSFELAKPSFEPAKPSFDLAKPSFEPAKPSFELAKPSFQPAKPLFELAKPAFEPAKPFDLAEPFELATTFEPLIDMTPLTATTIAGMVAPPVLNTRSSTGSLSALGDAAAKPPRVATRLSCSSLPVLADVPTAVEASGSCHSSHSSLAGDETQKLNYATLDLKCTDDPPVIPPPASPAISSGKGWYIAPPGEEMDEPPTPPPLTYAQIVFTKTDVWKTKG